MLTCKAISNIAAGQQLSGRAHVAVIHVLHKLETCHVHERLANPARLSAATPMHLPHLIGPFQHYLWILKTCHAGADMDVALQMARGQLDGDLAWQLTDLLQNRNEWWVPGKLVQLRGRLADHWKVRTTQQRGHCI